MCPGQRGQQRWARYPRMNQTEQCVHLSSFQDGASVWKQISTSRFEDPFLPLVIKPTKETEVVRTYVETVRKSE